MEKETTIKSVNNIIPEEVLYWVMDKNGELLYCSTGLKKSLGIPTETLCNGELQDKITGQSKASFKKFIDSDNKNPDKTTGKSSVKELILQRENKTGLWLTFHIKKIPTANGKNLYLFVFSEKIHTVKFNYLFERLRDIYANITAWPIDDIIGSFTNLAEEVTGASFAYCFLARRQDNNFSKAIWSKNTEKHLVIPEIPDSYPFSSAGIWTESYITKKTTYYKKIPEVQLFNVLLGDTFEMKNILQEPLISNGLSVGVFGLVNKPSFSQDDFLIIKILAQQLNIYLYIKQKTSELDNYKKKLQYSEMRLMKSSNELLVANEKLKKTSEELKEALRKAEENELAKAGLLKSLSQEIRTPMNAIVGFADLLTQETVNETQKDEFLKIIDNSGKQMMQLVNDIIDLSKIQTGTLDIILRETSVNNIMQEIYMLYYPILWSKHKNRVKLKLKKGFPDGKDYILTDEKRLRQVLNNLVSNAVKYTKEGEIEISYRQISPDYLRFMVRDTGIGIPIDKLGKIFDQYAKKESTRDGTGIGLAISKSIVELLGGKLWVESAEEMGSTFFFTIPYEPANLPEVSVTTKSPGVKALLRNKKILIAEDETLSFKLLQKILAPTGAEIIHAENGKEALEMIKATNDFDLVLMDIRMPVMDGITATKKIKEFNSELPVIVQTSYTLYEEETEAKKAGCDDFVTKPINKDQLLLSVLEQIKS